MTKQIKESKINHIIRNSIKHSSKLYNKIIELEKNNHFIASCEVRNARQGELNKVQKWFRIRKENYGY